VAQLDRPSTLRFACLQHLCANTIMKENQSKEGMKETAEGHRATA
jgi:hypothetical protein